MYFENFYNISTRRSSRNYSQGSSKNNYLKKKQGTSKQSSISSRNYTEDSSRNTFNYFLRSSSRISLTKYFERSSKYFFRNASVDFFRNWDFIFKKKIILILQFDIKNIFFWATVVVFFLIFKTCFVTKNQFHRDFLYLLMTVATP